MIDHEMKSSCAIHLSTLLTVLMASIQLNAISLTFVGLYDNVCLVVEFKLEKTDFCSIHWIDIMKPNT